MKAFNIKPVDKTMQAVIQDKIDNLNKPKGSLGRLEEIAMQVCLIQQTLEPSLAHPCHLLLGGDHGIEREGVSVSPREVTWQQMINFTRGGGGVNMFCRQHGFKLRIVDVGVDYDFSIDHSPLTIDHTATPEEAHSPNNRQWSMVNGQWSMANGLSIIDRKIARGTRNFLYEPAMSEEEFNRAISIGSDLVDDCLAEGCRVLSIGEMGIANTSPSSIWMSLFGDIPLKDCIGAGAGLASEGIRQGIRHKYEVLAKAIDNFRVKSEELRVKNESNKQGSEGNSDSSLFTLHSSLQASDSSLFTLHSSLQASDSSLFTLRSSLDEVIRYFGGFEMVAAIGAMLRAAEQHVLILVDGFIMTACAIAAIRLYPAAQDYMLFTHCGDESGHKMMLDIVGAKPLLNLGLRLGEGTGALCAFPIVDSAVRMMNEMNNFDNAKITKYF